MATKEKILKNVALGYDNHRWHLKTWKCLLTAKLVIFVRGKQLKGWNKKRLKWFRSCGRTQWWMWQTNCQKERQKPNLERKSIRLPSKTKWCGLCPIWMPEWLSCILSVSWGMTRALLQQRLTRIGGTTHVCYEDHLMLDNIIISATRKSFCMIRMFLDRLTEEEF